jgi:hypothetical protein
LLEQGEIVHEEAAVLPFPTDNPVNHDAFHSDPPACWRSHKGALMRAVEREAGNDLRTLRHLLLGHPLLVRESGKQFSLKKGFQALATWPLAGPSFAARTRRRMPVPQPGQ